MKTAFQNAGVKQFGSGCAFLVVDPKSGKITIESLPNQDSPLKQGKQVLLGNDLWEHACYLSYRNRRPDYLNA
jgi:superoxide dismutase, Fe-Mn family